MKLIASIFKIKSKSFRRLPSTRVLDTQTLLNCPQIQFCFRHVVLEVVSEMNFNNQTNNQSTPFNLPFEAGFHFSDGTTIWRFRNTRSRKNKVFTSYRFWETVVQKTTTKTQKWVVTGKSGWDGSFQRFSEISSPFLSLLACLNPAVYFWCPSRCDIASDSYFNRHSWNKMELRGAFSENWPFK